MNYIGIDVGKFNHCCAVMNSEGEVLVEPFFFANNSDGFDALLHIIKPFRSSRHMSGLESTGHYGDNLLRFLLANDFQVGMINPISTDAKRKQKIRKTKNDKKDSLTICAVLQSRDYTHMTKNKLSLREGKQLTRYHHDLTASLNQAKNRLQKCIDIVFPEYNSIFATKYSKAYMAVLKECGSAKVIRETHLTHLKKIVSDASHGKINSDYPTRLKESAKTSIGEDNAVMTLEIKQLIASIELLMDQLDIVDKKIEELAHTLNSPIFTIPGIGWITGMSILCELGPIDNFSSHTKVIAYTGLDCAVYQSGQYNADKTAITKRGSPHIRLSLYQAALPLCRFNATFNEYYNRKRSEGKSHRCAQGHVVRKLLRVIFKLLTENMSFDSALCK